jgi:hypothetical protein
MTSPFRFLLAALACLLPLPALAAFTDNGDGTVTDTVTGLIWDKCSWGQSNTTDCSGGSASTHAWSAALGVAVTANTASHRGHTDWRLPNRIELESLVKIDASSPAIDTTAFPNTPSSAIFHSWSSTTDASTPTRAWYVKFSVGNSGTLDKTESGYVRLVRGGQSFAPFDALDTTAPGLSSVGVSGTTQTGTTLSATSDEAATGYWLVVARDATAPTATQVKAGADYGAVTKVASGSAVMTVNVAKNFSVTGLAASTNYDLYFAAADNSGNLVASPTKLQFATTTAASYDPGPSALYITGPNQRVAPTGSLPVELASGVADASGSTIDLPADVAVTLKLGGPRFIVTAQAAPAQLVLQQMAGDGQSVTVATVASGTVQVTAQNAGQTLLAVGDIPVQAGGADARLTAARDGDSLVLSVSQGFVVLPGARLASSGKRRRAASAEFVVYAGERATLDAAGLVTGLVLGTAAGGAAGDALTLALPDHLSIATTVPNLAATAARLGGPVQTAIAAAAGGTLMGVQIDGVLALDLDGQRLYLLPLGEVGIDPEREDGVSLAADGTATVSAAGVGVRFAPSVASLNRFAADLEQVLPGVQIAVQENGVIVATVGGTAYAVRPDWIAARDTATPSGFAVGTDGRLSYTRYWRRLALYPAFADHARLAAAVAAALPGAGVQTNADGTVTVSLDDARYTLTPADTLETAPAGAAAWRVGADGKAWLRNGDGTLQRFGIE